MLCSRALQKVFRIVGEVADSVSSRKLVDRLLPNEGRPKVVLRDSFGLFAVGDEVNMGGSLYASCDVGSIASDMVLVDEVDECSSGEDDADDDRGIQVIILFGA